MNRHIIGHPDFSLTIIYGVLRWKLDFNTPGFGVYILDPDIFQPPVGSYTELILYSKDPCFTDVCWTFFHTSNSRARPTQIIPKNTEKLKKILFFIVTIIVCLNK